jgi:hypothetical protein
MGIHWSCAEFSIVENSIDIFPKSNVEPSLNNASTYRSKNFPILTPLLPTNPNAIIRSIHSPRTATRNRQSMDRGMYLLDTDINAATLINKSHLFFINVTPTINIAEPYRSNVEPYTKIVFFYRSNVEPYINIVAQYRSNAEPYIKIVARYTSNAELYINIVA